MIAAKKTKIETMIDSYGLTHQAVDLTQYWQNLSETAYSHPSDNVYRKNVLTRNMMNEIVDANPSFEIKVTSELDLYPNPGDRMTELLHLPIGGIMTFCGTTFAFIEVPNALLIIAKEDIGEVEHYVLVQIPIFIRLVAAVGNNTLAPKTLELRTKTDARSKPLTYSYVETESSALLAERRLVHIYFLGSISSIVVSTNRQIGRAHV